MKKYFSFLAFILMGALSLSIVSCGDDDEEDFSGGGNIIGTWSTDLASDISKQLDDDDYITNMEQYYQFKNDGTFTEVLATTYSDDWVKWFNEDKQEIEIERGTWKISNGLLYIIYEDNFTDYSNNTYKYSVKGNKLTLTSTSGIILSVTFTRIPDSTIDKYLK